MCKAIYCLYLWCAYKIQHLVYLMDFMTVDIKVISVVLVTALSLVGCATPVQKDWSATGGSKSDGTIRLSYQSTLYEKPILDESQALRLAKTRCKSWGYSSVEAFGGVITQCQQMDAYLGCTESLVTKEYQCID